MHDVIIRGGSIFDGSGSNAATGDVAVKDGTIVAVGGSIAEPARQTIDADGAIVTPAWVDIHTHYDGQVTWDEEMDPSASHGVGTIVMGNCGVGFAPVKPGGQRELIELMEGVEDIPGTALYEGMPWGAWETYPQYLDYLAGRKYALNVASMIAHGAVRSYVLGPERGNADAAEPEVRRMAEIVEDALRAGAVGFILKDAGPVLLAEAVRAASTGDALISPSITLRLFRHLAPAKTSAVAKPAAPLSERETEVIRAIAKGRTNNEIAAELFSSVSTVKTHLTSVQQKLGLRNRVEIAAWAWESRLTDSA